VAESTVVKVPRDGLIVLSDSASAHTYNIAYEPGDFSYNVPDYAVELMLDRGQIGTTPSIRIGADSPMTGSFSAYFRDPGDTAKAYMTLMEIAHRYGASANVGQQAALTDGTVTGWTSTLGTSGDVFTISIALVIDGSAFGEADKTLTFKFCALRADMKEAMAGNVISLKFTSYSIRPVLS